MAGNSIGEAAPQDQTPFSDTPFGAQGQRYLITAHIYGPLNSDKLQIDLMSSPGGLTRAQMLAALVPAGTLVAAGLGSGGQGVLEQQLQTALSSVLLPTLLTPLTQSLANAIGFESVDVNYDPGVGGIVALTKNIGPRLQVTYTRSVGARTPGAVNATLSPPQYELKLGYSLTNHLQFDVSTNDQRDNTALLEGVFGF